ncbi:DUF2235 domain-containing protein [Mycena chlorophos]|uniref:DUF2235 domain-containing protein n=1 Tax=Mycena chlorophos TaxID=658473 RepID=A0A8H6SJ60_MYCCL|nr:DUF2235 domain-containing protein [Mycena chlorophos]
MSAAGDTEQATPTPTPAPAPAPPTATATPRTLVLVFDGTADEYNAYDTNAVRLFGLLKKDDFRQQLCYYQSGIGTYFKPSIVSPLFDWCAKVLDEAFAFYLNEHVMDGYRFLMDNYHEGDRICLFGFSRGAYTARALAGMLHKVGLLPRSNEEQVPFAFKMYKSTGKSADALAAGYKQTFCQDVQIEFLGVWETVDSVGVVMTRTLPFTSTNTSIKTFRHALALDERRVKFLPYVLEPKTSPQAKNRTTDALEVWFVGCHEDIGGGAVANDIQRSLADITLRWMVRETMAYSCGIRYVEGAMAKSQIELNYPPSSSSSAASTAKGKARAVEAELEAEAEAYEGDLNGSEAVDKEADAQADEGPAPAEPQAEVAHTRPILDRNRLSTMSSNKPLPTTPPASIDAIDATKLINDALRFTGPGAGGGSGDGEVKAFFVALGWRVVELLPLVWKVQDVQGKWHTKFGLHLWKGRQIVDPNPNFHITVKDRIEDGKLAYVPKAVYAKGAEVYVE